MKFEWINQTWIAIAHHSENFKKETSFCCELFSKNVTKKHMKNISVATPYPAHEQMQTFLLNHYGKNMGNFQVQSNTWTCVLTLRAHCVKQESVVGYHSIESTFVWVAVARESRTLALYNSAMSQTLYYCDMFLMFEFLHNYFYIRPLYTVV